MVSLGHVTVGYVVLIVLCQSCDGSAARICLSLPCGLGRVVLVV